MDFASQNLTAGQLNAIVKILGGEEGALKFLRGEHVVQPAVIPEPPPEPVLNFIVRVNRSVKPTFNHGIFTSRWLDKPELECLGPAEYNLQDGVVEWLHDDQKRNSVDGNTIYSHLKKNDALATCLNMQDGLAIKERGIAVFHKLFAGKAVFLWKSVIRGDCDWRVPYLHIEGNEVVLGAFNLDDHWFSCHPALRFSK